MGIEQTRGHTADGGGLRGHSVGDFYPYIVYATGPADDLHWHVMDSTGVKCAPCWWSSAKAACCFAKKLKAHDDEQAIAANHGDPLCYGV